VIVVAAACKTSSSPPARAVDASPAATLRVFDSEDTQFHGGQELVPVINVHVCVACSECTNALTGTFAGRTMTSPTPDGQPQCGAGELELVTSGSGSTTDDTVHVTDNASLDITAQLPDDALAARAVGSAGVTLCPGQVATYSWLPASDLVAGTGSVAGAPDEFCEGEACAEMYTGLAATTTIGAAITFMPSATVPPTLTKATAITLTFLVPGAAGSGDAVSCMGATSCTYAFAHAAQTTATIDPTCP
jgi:hypothetical protein